MIIGIDGTEANVKQRVGANQYAFELLHGLSRLKTSHHWVIYLREPAMPDLPESTKTWSYRVFGPKRFWTQWRLPLDLFVHKPRPDVFFSPGHYAPRWSPVPVAISIMDLGFLKFPEQFTKKDLYQLASWTAGSVKSAKHIFAISESTKNDIIKAYHTPEEKITVTYPGYDQKRFDIKILRDKDIERIKDSYKIVGDYILFLGTLKPSKNIEGLLEAHNILISQYPNIQLVIAGKKGWMYDTIFAKVRESGLEDKVIFTDFVSDDEVAGLVSGADVFVLPSFWEGFGIPVVEAMACGVPVVVSDVGSLPEVVGEAGVIVNPNDPQSIAQGIKKALKDKEELRKKGLEQVKKFSWENCAKKTLTVLEELI